MDTAMKLILTLVLFVLTGVGGFAAEPFQNVTVTTNGVLRTPTNFFTANSNSIAVSVTTNSIPGLATALGDLQSGKQPTNSALTALAGNPALYQATNANLTTLSAGGNSSNFFRGDGQYAQVSSNNIPGLPGDIANLQTAISARQPASSVLTNVSALTSGTSTNFLAGDGTFKQVTTNMIPGHNGDISNLQSAITARQVASAALTNLAGGDGSALTNVARIGLGQPEVSGVAFDGATSGTRVVSLSQALGTNDFTLWARFKVPANSSAFNRTIAAFTASATTALASTDWLMFFNASGQLIVQQYGSSVVNIRQKLISGFQTAYSGQIVDVVSVRTGTNCLVYVNGSLASTSDGTAGTPPGWDQSVGSTYFRLGSYADTGSGDTSGIFDSQIYRTAVFNRALSAADVQSLIKNGIDPSDQWGNSTVPVVSFNPSTLNGGFETNSLNAAGTWSSNGTGTFAIDTSGTNAVSGSNALKMTLDGAGANSYIAAANGSASVLPANSRWRVSYWGKKDPASPTTGSWRLDLTGQSALLPSGLLTTNYTQITGEVQTTTASQLIFARGTVAAGSIQFIDNIEATRIGAILDLDFTTGGGTNVFDRSSNSLTATNYGGVSWTLPNRGQYVAGNSTIASNLTVAGTITGTVAGYQTTNTQLTTLINNSGANLTNVAMRGLGQPEVSGLAYDGVSGTKTAGLAQNIGTNDFSVWTRFRVPVTAPAANNYQEVIKLSSDGTYIGRAFDVYFSQTTLSFALWGATTSDFTAYNVAGFQTNYAGQIVDLVFTRSGTNATVYFNGVAQALSATTGGTPPTFAGSITSTRADIGGSVGTGTACAFSERIFRTAIFNRALSQADVTSLINNGIDPADQWGNSTVPVVSYSPSTLNGGFETNSLGTAGTWQAYAAGGSTTTIDTTGTNSHSGSNSGKFVVTPGGDAAFLANNGSTSMTVAGKRHRGSVWSKISPSSTNTQATIQMYDGLVRVASSSALTTNWQQVTAEWVCSTPNSFIIQQYQNTANATIFVDDVELTRIGAILDLDFTTGGGTNVFDRSSNSLTATNYGGVSWTLPNKGGYVGGNLTVASNLTVTGTTTISGYQPTNAALTALSSNPSLYQATNSALTVLAANDGSALTNVARIGLGQPEVSGVNFDAQQGTYIYGASQNIGTNDFTVAMRVRMPASMPATRYLIGLSSSPTNAIGPNGYHIEFDSSGRLVSVLANAALESSYKRYDPFVSTYANQIVDIAAIRSGTNLLLYVNGNALTEATTVFTGSNTNFGTVSVGQYLIVGYRWVPEVGSANFSWTGGYQKLSVFNRALSASDVQSLIKNGIDPSDQWGNSTVPVVSFNPSTLNGGFETNSLNAAGTWGTFAGGSSAITIDTTGTNFHSGANSLKMAIDSANSTAAIFVNNSASFPSSKRRVSFWAKQSASSTNTAATLTCLNNGVAMFVSGSLTTNWTQYSSEGTPATGVIEIDKSGSAANATIFVDDVEITRIGSILDLDFTTGYGTNVWDRSSNSLNATNYGGVSWTMPVVALNTGTIQATNLTATYISGNGSAITSTGATNQNQLVTLAQLESFTANGLHMFFYGSSNAAGINSGAAGHTNWAYSTASSAAAVTNTVASPTNSQYLCEFVSNDTFTQFASGVVNIEMWMFFNSGGSRAVSVLAEAYIYDSVGGTNYVELTPASAAQDLSGTLTKYLYSIPIPDITPPNASRLVVKFKVGSVASTPTVSMVSQGVYTSHAAFSVPLSSYVLKTGDTMTGGLTLPSLTSTNFIDLKEGSSAGNPATNYARLLIVPSGAKQALIIKWSDGTTNTIATHP